MPEARYKRCDPGELMTATTTIHPDSSIVDIAATIEKEEHRFLEEIFLASIESAGVRGRLLLPGLPSQRPSLNAMLMAAYSSGKSTIMQGISEKLINICDDATFPGVVGTITRDGQLLKGAAAMSGGKVLAIDEAQRLSMETVEALKGLVENGRTLRALGYGIEGQLRTYRSKHFSMKPLPTRNGFVVNWQGAMWLMGEYVPPHFRGGWLSRFINLSFSTEKEDIYRLTKGHGMLDLSCAKGTTWGQGCRKEEEFDMPIPNYHESVCDPFMRLIEDHRYFERINNQNYGLIPRMLFNIVRLQAHYMRTGKTADNAATRALKYSDAFMYGAMRGLFTMNQLKAFDSVLNGADTINDLIKTTGLHELTVRRIVNDLVNLGIVVKR